MAAAQQHIVKGIYHPRADKPFESLNDYLAWYRAQRLVPESAPLAGILFYQTNYKVRDLEHIDALIAALEKRGIGAVPVFGWPVPELVPLLGEPGRSPLRLLYCFNLGFAQASDSETLERYGLHVIDLMTSRDSLRSVEQVRLRDHARAVVHAGGAAGDRGRYRADRRGHHGEGRGRGRSGDQADTGTNRYGGQPRRALAGVARQAERGKAHRPDLLQQPAGQGKHRRQLPQRLPNPAGGAGAAARKRIPDRRPAAHRKRAGSATGNQRPQHRGMGSRRVGSAGGEGPCGAGSDEEIPRVVCGAAQAVSRLRERGLGTAREVAVDDHHVARRREVLRRARRAHGQYVPGTAAAAHQLRAQHGDGPQHGHAAAALLHRGLSVVPQRVQSGRGGALRAARHSGISAGQERGAGRMGQLGGDPGRSAERVLLHHGRRRRIDHGAAAQRGGDDQPPDADGGGCRRSGPVRGAAADLREPAKDRRRVARARGPIPPERHGRDSAAEAGYATGPRSREGGVDGGAGKDRGVSGCDGSRTHTGGHAHGGQPAGTGPSEGGAGRADQAELDGCGEAAVARRDRSMGECHLRRAEARIARRAYRRP